jgi:hybrid cluster-associated redox disulfide protein
LIIGKNRLDFGINILYNVIAGQSIYPHIKNYGITEGKIVAEVMTITKDMLIGDILDIDMGIAKFLLEIGMHCLGCPSARGESLEEACEVHSVDSDELITKINGYLAEK